MIGQFSLYQCKGMPGTAALHVFCNQARVKENWPRTKWGSNCKVTGNKCFNNALLLDKFKQ